MGLHSSLSPSFFSALLPLPPSPSSLGFASLPFSPRLFPLFCVSSRSLLLHSSFLIFPSSFLLFSSWLFASLFLHFMFSSSSFRFLFLLFIFLFPFLSLHIPLLHPLPLMLSFLPSSSLPLLFSPLPLL